MATWAIGDVHGCYRTLRALLARPEIGERDRLWFVGDLVNRGPRSLDTLRLVCNLSDRVTAVLGNHDLHFLARAAGVAEARRLDSLDELLAAPDVDELAEWLQRRRLLVNEDGVVLVHAGLLPSWSVAEAQQRAQKVETALRSAGATRYLEAFRPTSEAPGGDREMRQVLDDLRVFTLMRTLDGGGRPAYDYTGPLDALPAGRTAWFDAGRNSQRVVCGHWAAAGLVLRDDVASLDTGCAWGGPLTALRLEDGRIEQQENVDR